MLVRRKNENLTQLITRLRLYGKRMTFPSGLFSSDVMVWRSVHLF